MKRSLAILLVIISSKVFSQSIPITNLYDHRTYYNPAFVGNNPGVSNATLTNRLLFRPNSGPLTLNMAMVEFNSCKLPQVGFGLIANQQNEGDGRLKTNLIRPIIAYKVKITENVLFSTGIQFNLQSNYIDWGNLIFSDQLNPLQGNVYTSSNVNANWTGTNNLNVGIGGKFDYLIRPFGVLKKIKMHRLFPKLKQIYDNGYFGNVGFTYNNAGNNNDGLLGNNIIQRTRVFHAGLAIPTAGFNYNLNLEIVPHIRHQTDFFGKTKYQIIDMGAFIQTSIGYMTLGHRISDNFITKYNALIVGIAPTIKLNNNSRDALRIAYHIDLNYNTTNRANAFANIVNHELSLIWIFNSKSCEKLHKVSICENVSNDVPKLINSNAKRF
jgi:hypothetical protein